VTGSAELHIDQDGSAMRPCLSARSASGPGVRIVIEILVAVATLRGFVPQPNLQRFFNRNPIIDGSCGFAFDFINFEPKAAGGHLEFELTDRPRSIS